MSRIQELLANQRKGISNASANEKPAAIESVTQHTDKKEQPYVEIKTEQPKQPSLAERLRAGKKFGISSNSGTSVVEQGFIENDKPNKTTEKTQALSDTDRPELLKDSSIGSLAEQRHGNSDNQNQDKAAEEIMPAGLSMLAQIKWKKEHGPAKASANNNLDKSGEVSKGIAEIRTGNNAQPEGESSPTGSSGGNSESASRTADDQKSNDGVANIEELKHNLAYLANNIENKDLVGQVVRTICSQIKNSPELTPMMTNADVNLVVRGARMAYQIAAMKKQEKADTRRAKDKDTVALDNFFKDAGINFNM